MRKVIYMHMMSLDGYIEADKSYHGPNWAVSDEELQKHFVELEGTIDTHLYGRRVYEQVAAWWPTVAMDQSMPEHMAEYGRLWLGKPKVVFSNTLDHVEWNTRMVKANAAEEIAALKAQPGKDLSLYGAVLASSVIPLGLVDEYRCYVNPAVLGGGTPMFPKLDHPLFLRLVQARTFDCGLVLLHYRNADEYK